MIRFATIGILMLTASCVSTRPDVVSSINYLQAPVDVNCAFAAIRDADGFSVASTITPRGTAQQISAFFNDDLPIQILVRDLMDGTSEVSAFVKLPVDATPLDRREADFAVRQADQGIYRSCTADGQSNGDDAEIIIETEDNQ